MDLKLKGKKAIVTGASRGIGLRIARQLADEGMDLAICARGEEGLQKAIAELTEKGVRVIGSTVNVLDGEAYKTWLKSAADDLGGVDVFVSNVTGGPADGGEEGWKNGFQGDIMGAVRGCETLLPYLRKSESGAIVFIASISGMMSKALPMPGVYAYGSSKAALVAYGAQLSKDLAKEGIRVNAVSPGPVYFKGGAWDYIEQNMPEAYADAMDKCVIGRLGAPEDIAAAVAFLASPVSGFTVGQNLHIDGGYMQHINF